MDISWIKKKNRIKKGNFCILMSFWGENVHYNWIMIYPLDATWRISMLSYTAAKYQFLTSTCTYKKCEYIYISNRYQNNLFIIGVVTVCCISILMCKQLFYLPVSRTTVNVLYNFFPYSLTFPGVAWILPGISALWWLRGTMHTLG